MEDDVLFDALETTSKCASQPIEENEYEEEEDEMILFRSLPSGGEDQDQIQALTTQLNQLQTESNAFKVQSVAETSMLRQQLNQQHSVAKHLKQMLKNLSDKYTTLQGEHKIVKGQLESKTIQLSTAEERIGGLLHQIDQLNHEKTKLYHVETLYETLQQDHHQLAVACEQWKTQAMALENVQEQNKQLENERKELLHQQDLANKRTHQIIKDLRKSLQEERSKPPPEPILLPSPPLAVKCIYAKDSQEGSEIIQEFALRIEQLLEQNALLTERVRFAEENTRLVAMDLERKRLLLSQMCHNANMEDKPQVYALAISKAAQVERLETMETLLFKTLVENLQFMKCESILSSVELEQPQISVYKTL